MQDKKDPLSQLEPISVIGKGSYAKVALVKKKSTGGFLALKSMKKKYIQEQGQVHRVVMQREVLVAIRHPFLVGIHSSFQTDKKIYLLLQYCPGGELFRMLSKQKKFSQGTTRFYAAQMLLALQYLHSKHIIYRDLKPQNIMICRDGYIKLTDFGLSKTNIEGEYDTHSICGTPEYMAPEVVGQKGHGKAVDWWCLGSLIYEMLTGLPPFFCENRAELFDKIKNGQPYYDAAWSKSLKDLLSRLFLKNPEQRMQLVPKIKEHPWFAMIDWGEIEGKTAPAPFLPKLKSENDVSNFEKKFTKCSYESQTDSCEEGHLKGFSYEKSVE